MIALACSSARGNLVGPTSLTERPDNVASGEFPHIAKDSVFITSDGSALSESLIVCVSASLSYSSTSLSTNSSSAGASGDWETPFELSIDICHGIDRSSELADAADISLECNCLGCLGFESKPTQHAF